MSDAIAVTAVDRPVSGNRVTWFSLCFSLFSMIIIRQIFHGITPGPNTTLTISREACMFASAGLLVWLVLQKERRSLRSIGIGTSPIWKSVAWGLVMAVACIVPAAIVMPITGYGHGPTSQTLAKLPTWLIFIVTLRAGLVEELFYRAYPIERLQELGFPRFTSWAIPLVIFSVAHWTGGAASVLMAMVLGAILTAFYQWRRDLISNMFGHFMVDFVTNVLPALFA